MTFQHRPDDYGMGFGSSPDAGLGNNAGLGHSNGYGSNAGLGGSSGGNHIYSKWGTGGLGFTGGLGWSGGLRESRSAKFAKFLGGGGNRNDTNRNGMNTSRSADRSRSGSDSDDMSGLGGSCGLGGDSGGLDGLGGDDGSSGLGGFGLGDERREVMVAASHPVHLPVLLDNLNKLETARRRVFKGLDKNGDGAILALFERKWFKRLQQLCDHLGAQGNAVGGLLAHTTALPTPGLNMALQQWMAAVTNNLYTLHTEMESVAVQRIILMAGDVSDASDMADAVGSGDPSEVVDTATGIVTTDAAQDICEKIFGRVDGPLSRCYKILVQRAAEMDNCMMPALQHELSGSGWNVPPGPGQW